MKSAERLLRHFFKSKAQGSSCMWRSVLIIYHMCAQRCVYEHVPNTSPFSGSSLFSRSGDLCCADCRVSGWGTSKSSENQSGWDEGISLAIPAMLHSTEPKKATWICCRPWNLPVLATCRKPSKQDKQRLEQFKEIKEREEKYTFHAKTKA